MSSLGESIFTELKKFYHAFVDKKILKTAEEVAANTNDHNLASAVVVGERALSLSLTAPGKSLVIKLL